MVSRMLVEGDGKKRTVVLVGVRQEGDDLRGLAL